MFDFNKLGDVTKIAGQAKQMQEKQERFQTEQVELLNEISKKLGEVITILEERK